MKRKVHLSIYCKIITAATIGLLIFCLVMAFGNPRDFYILLAISVGVLVSGAYYCPVSIETRQTGLAVHRLCSGQKLFPYSEIISVDSCYPSPGGLRLCGSGGFMGYWDYFHDIMIGNYFGYYGDRSQAILIRLKGGRQYVVSCEESHEMIKEIEKHIQHL